ncbi:MAG: hypothetical protein R3C53_09475 [Pirellulaceae bacterium]
MHRILNNGLILLDRPRSGGENMLLDEQMLAAAAEFDRPLLRVYQWSRPTLSLGYFQKYADRLKHAPSVDIEVVRRATGGGAIVHHHEWTYALALPNSAMGARGNTSGHFGVGASQAVYDCIHTTVVEWLTELGICAAMFPNRKVPEGSAELVNFGALQQAAPSCVAPCSFLCFERRSKGDVVAGSATLAGQTKVMGSAQRRSKGALLQHGSLLLARSPHAPTLPGLMQLGVSLPHFSRSEFPTRLCRAVTALTGKQFNEADHVCELLGRGSKESLAQFGVAGKYTHVTWVGGR